MDCIRGKALRSRSFILMVQAGTAQRQSEDLSAVQSAAPPLITGLRSKHVTHE